jgi:DNA topoisomerase-1
MSVAPTLPTPSNPATTARQAGLRYVSDARPGIQRRRAGKGFRYLDPDQQPIRDGETLARIRALVIPPAWTDVWICPYPNGHIQAVGRDERGRKQYRYHDRWRAVQDEAKYDRMIAFGKALPRIRRRLERDLALPGLEREKVLATVVRLLETSLIRVGNDEYARTNGSYGLTTLKNRHAAITGTTIRFRFRGKSGIAHEVEVSDRRLARVVRQCQDLPGQELFQYVDQAGEVRDVTSGDVNDYLREVAGEEFSAKDFRTWAGTVMAALALRELEGFDSQAQAKRNIMAAVKSVAKRLGNTPTVCRMCYVHPHVIDAYLEGTMLDAARRRADQAMASLTRLRPEEAAVLALLQRRLAQEERSDRRRTRRRTRPNSPRANSVEAQR